MLEFKKYLKIGIAAASLYMVSTAAFLSANIDNEVTLSLGWRNDRIEKKARNHGDSESNNRGHKIKLRNANLWQVGTQFWFGMPDCWCGCGTEWLSNLYVRGNAYYGWYSDGKLHGHKGGNNSDSSSGHGSHKLRNSWAADYSIGVGYLFPIGCDFLIGPVGGYAYDQQHIRSRHHNHHDSSCSSSISGSSSSSSSSSSVVANNDGSSSVGGRGFRLNQKWQGGWIGFDSVLNWCDWNFGFGYEYHFADSRGGRGHHNSSASGDCGSGSSSSGHHRHHKRGYGNVVHLGARWNLCDCWDILVGFKYQDYQAKRHDKWQAYGLTLDLGMRF